MKFRAHDYQKAAIRWILSHPVCALLLDCGLGKTAITLTAIWILMYELFDIGKVLVVAPLRVASIGWPSELSKWDHLKGLRMSVAVGSVKERMAALTADADIYVINRENVKWLTEESGLPFDYDCLVLDELSSFKNHDTARFRALMKVRPRIKRVIGLTGTPSSNGLMDLWAEYRLLDMGERLGRFITRYRLRWFEPDRRNGLQIFSYRPRPGAEDEIHDAVSDITVSMRSRDFLKMPECIHARKTVTLSGDERRLYGELKAALAAEWKGREITASNAAVLSGKLMQLANGCVYSDDGVTEIHSRKLDALEDLIEEANGKSILIAYWFRHDRERIASRLDALGVRYADLKSDKAIADWNAGRLDAALLHPASAGHGLNLQDGGSTLVWFGPVWSLELYQQTNARLWRQGQKDRTVVINHIVAEGTVDERILSSLERKEGVQDALLEAVKAEVRGWT